jgi:hypothetical protein
LWGDHHQHYHQHLLLPKGVDVWRRQWPTDSHLLCVSVLIRSLAGALEDFQLQQHQTTEMIEFVSVGWCQAALDAARALQQEITPETTCHVCLGLPLQ